MEIIAFGLLVDFRLSFPSGHASSSAYAAVFIVLYMQYAIKTTSFQLSKVFAQFLFICLAVTCSLSRISDYFHHWSDVLAGFLIGMFSAIYTVWQNNLCDTRYVSLCFTREYFCYCNNL